LYFVIPGCVFSVYSLWNNLRRSTSLSEQQIFYRFVYSYLNRWPRMIQRLNGPINDHWFHHSSFDRYDSLKFCYLLACKNSRLMHYWTRRMRHDNARYSEWMITKWFRIIRQFSFLAMILLIPSLFSSIWWNYCPEIPATATKVIENSPLKQFEVQCNSFGTFMKTL